jgi:hypothetical protein
LGEHPDFLGSAEPVDGVAGFLDQAVVDQFLHAVVQFGVVPEEFIAERGTVALLA